MKKTFIIFCALTVLLCGCTAPMLEAPPENDPSNEVTIGISTYTVTVPADITARDGEETSLAPTVPMDELLSLYNGNSDSSREFIMAGSWSFSGNDGDAAVDCRLEIDLDGENGATLRFEKNVAAALNAGRVEPMAISFDAQGTITDNDTIEFSYDTDGYYGTAGSGTVDFLPDGAVILDIVPQGAQAQQLAIENMVMMHVY